MIAGVACPDANPSEAFSTFTDSASPGRKLEGSFCCADSNLPASGPSAAASTSHSASTRNFERRPETTAANLDII